MPLARSSNVTASASPPLSMTGAGALRLQVCHRERRFPKPSFSQNKNVTGEIGCRSLITEAQEAHIRRTTLSYETKPINTYGRGCDRAGRLCHGASAT